MRRRSELAKDWKIPISAELAGKMDFVLNDPLTRKPKYGARVRLVEGLLQHWLDMIAGKPLDERKPLPTLEELRSL